MGKTIKKKKKEKEVCRNRDIGWSLNYHIWELEQLVT